jgi:hypothetical protein
MSSFDHLKLMITLATLKIRFISICDPRCQGIDEPRKKHWEIISHDLPTKQRAFKLCGRKGIVETIAIHFSM